MKDYYSISTDRNELDIHIIHQYLSHESYWAKGRSITVIKKSIHHSLCFGVYDGIGGQVGFARVVTDHAVFAWILDVFILKEHRGIGLGKRLMEAIIGHPDLQGLQRWGLGTEDAHGLYKKFGFTSLHKPQNMMEKVPIGDLEGSTLE